MPSSISLSYRSGWVSSETSWLLYPILQNVSGVASAVGQAEWRSHDSHGLGHLIHLIIISCPEGCKLRPTDTAQGHRLGVSVRDDPVNHVRMGTRGICMQSGTSQTYECSRTPDGLQGLPQKYL
jgi:hypothetical protein